MRTERAEKFAQCELAHTFRRLRAPLIGRLRLEAPGVAAWRDGHVENRSLAAERNEGRDRPSLARSTPTAGTYRAAANNARADAVVGQTAPLSARVAFVQSRGRAEPIEQNRSDRHPARRGPPDL